ncbi:AIPR family protein [Microvirga yunnanensis]|uniref:AIPR family protein n=1 Tax=Microvirga yunnanensis TaxID=2953740 RepID=UPI0021C7C120|nr:AIPR family protein [Microvirga sp. HBU65207]
MNESLEEFHLNFFNGVRAGADADGRFMETAFIEHFCEWLIDSGELDTLDLAPYRAARGMRVDAYAGDPAEYEGVLTLIISDFNQDDKLATLRRADMDLLFKRLENFLSASLTSSFRDQLEESSPGFGLAELIRTRRDGIRRVRLLIVTNRKLSARIEGLEAGTLEGYPVTYTIWDISRLHRLVASGSGKEDLQIDFAADFSQALPCLPAHMDGANYKAFLVVVPGTLLAEIYGRWGARLLEQNVRTFLQARGSVNKGIRQTILTDPGMFFAYNNGVTATAEDVETVTEGTTTYLKSVRNLQIVNGGQTTASIFSAKEKDKAELDRIFVQMKLSVVDPEKAVEVVPRISEYANSQNRVNAADFFSNHPFHVRMQEFSRRIWAPSPDGSFSQTKWFYERARGQYLDAKAYLSAAKKKAFENEYPKNQCFTKTDLAKFETVWEGLPHIVSKGAQHTFAEFAKVVAERWQKNPDQFNEFYFRSAVAKAIIFREMEKLVVEQPWYDGGYRAQIIAYTLSKLAAIVKDRKQVVDFEAVWKRQTMPSELKTALLMVADQVRHVITSPEAGSANMSEWAKKQACWGRVQALEVDLPVGFYRSLNDVAEQKIVVSDAKKIQKMDNGIEAQKKVLELGAAFWSGAAGYARKKRLLGPADNSLLALASKVPMRIPDEKQSLRLMEAMKVLELDGFKVPAQ